MHISEAAAVLAGLVAEPISCSPKRISLDMNGQQTLTVYPPRPAEGASACALRRRKHCVAPVSKDGAAPWFETPRTRLWNLGRPKIAAPHHEAGRDHACIKFPRRGAR